MNAARLQFIRQRIADASPSVLRADTVALSDEVLRLRESLEWCANTIHHAHHGRDTGEWRSCDKGFCQSVVTALRLR